MFRRVALSLGFGLAVVGLVAPPASAEAEFSEVALHSVQATLDGDQEAKIPGTAWGVEPAENRVVVTYDDTVTGTVLDRLETATQKYGAAVRLEHIDGRMSLNIRGGNEANGRKPSGGWASCSLGFNVIHHQTGEYYFLTAGHCVKEAATWYAHDYASKLGDRIAYRHPGTDYGIVKYTNNVIDKPGVVDLYDGRSQDITHARRAQMNEFVCKSGQTTKKTCGYVRQLGATANFPDGTLYGMIKTSICTDDGDSGGPMWHGTAALGLLAGSTDGGCPADESSWFMPVPQILSDHGLLVY